MGTIKKRNIKFCPLCAAPTTPQKEGAYSTCTGCGLEFMVNEKAKPSIPQVGGHAHNCECGEKIRHGSLADAYARALGLPDIPSRSRLKMQFYLCRWCYYWHIGHEGRKKGKAVVFYTLAQIEKAGIENLPDPALTDEALSKRKIVASEKIIDQNPTSCSII